MIFLSCLWFKMFSYGRQKYSSEVDICEIIFLSRTDAVTWINTWPSKVDNISDSNENFTHAYLIVSCTMRIRNPRHNGAFDFIIPLVYCAFLPNKDCLLKDNYKWRSYQREKVTRHVRCQFPWRHLLSNAEVQHVDPPALKGVAECDTGRITCWDWSRTGPLEPSGRRSSGSTWGSTSTVCWCQGTCPGRNQTRTSFWRPASCWASKLELASWSGINWKLILR